MCNVAVYILVFHCELVQGKVCLLPLYYKPWINDALKFVKLNQLIENMP